ncbi:MAG: hypothetical protein SFY70_03695 [Bacteroidia bacterium]|nr:hypothetical protein [Bacteroidia bacterium]
MRSLFLFLAFVLCSPLLGLSQYKTLDIPIEASAIPKDGKVVFAEYPLTNRRYAFVQSEEKLTVITLDSGLKVVERLEFKTDKKYRGGVLMGSYRSGNELVLVGRLTDRKGFYTFNFVPGEKPKFVAAGPYTDLVTGEPFAGLSYPDRYVVLSLMEGTSRVELTIFSGASASQQATVDLSSWVRGLSVSEMLKENQTGQGGTYPYLGAATVLQKDISNDFRETRRRLKIYTVEGNVVFSLDHRNGTNIASVGLNDFQVRYNEFKAIPIEAGPNGVKLQTSMVYGNSMYMAAMTEREIAVRVADIFSGRPLNIYLADAESGCEWARTPYVQYVSKPFTETKLEFQQFLALSQDPRGFQLALSVLRESADGIELALGMNHVDPETEVDVTALFKTRLSLDGSVVLTGAPKESAADAAIGYEKLILTPWALSRQRVGDELWIGTYNVETQSYTLAAWPLARGAEY